MRYETQLPYMTDENQFYGQRDISIAWELFEREQREDKMKYDNYISSMEYTLPIEEDHEDLEWFYGYDAPTWEEEYSLFLEEVEEDFDSSLDSWMQPMICDLKHLQGELVKHKRYKKKAKHTNDKKWTDYEKRPSRVEWYEWGDRYNAYAKNTTHKHKRAEKVFEKEAYDKYFSYVWDEDYPIDGIYKEAPPRCKGNCADGYCIRCDWDYAMYNLHWDDDEFIEYWDWEDVWIRYYKNKEEDL